MDSIIKKISDVLRLSSHGAAPARDVKKTELVRKMEEHDRVTISAEARRRALKDGSMREEDIS